MWKSRCSTPLPPPLLSWVESDGVVFFTNKADLKSITSLKSDKWCWLGDPTGCLWSYDCWALFETVPTLWLLHPIRLNHFFSILLHHLACFQKICFYFVVNLIDINWQASIQLDVLLFTNTRAWLHKRHNERGNGFDPHNIKRSWVRWTVVVLWTVVWDRQDDYILIGARVWRTTKKLSGAHI